MVQSITYILIKQKAVNHSHQIMDNGFPYHHSSMPYPYYYNQLHPSVMPYPRPMPSHYPSFDYQQKDMDASYHYYRYPTPLEDSKNHPNYSTIDQQAPSAIKLEHTLEEQLRSNYQLEKKQQPFYKNEGQLIIADIKYEKAENRYLYFDNSLKKEKRLNHEVEEKSNENDSDYVPNEQNKQKGMYKKTHLTKERERYRKMKVEKYLESRSHRMFDKKIVYGCRKKIADERIRFKGRFINGPQAMRMLGLRLGDGYTKDQLKEMMSELEKCYHFEQ